MQIRRKYYMRILEFQKILARDLTIVYKELKMHIKLLSSCHLQIHSYNTSHSNSKYNQILVSIILLNLDSTFNNLSSPKLLRSTMPLLNFYLCFRIIFFISVSSYIALFLISIFKNFFVFYISSTSDK